MFTEPIKTFSHQGIVKGISWDPTGRYLASQVCPTHATTLMITDRMLLV